MKWLRIAAVVYAIALFAVNHLPPGKLPQANVNDKLQHFVAYAILGAMVAMGFRIAWWKALLACSLLGGMDELTQPLIGRMCELNDWLADSAGALLAIIITTWLRNRFMPPGE